MSRANDGLKRAILIAENNLQSCLLKESIERQVQLDIKLLSPEKITSNQTSMVNGSSYDYLIIDYPAINKKHMQGYSEFKASLPGSGQEVLFNTPPELTSSDILQWQDLVGIFYSSDTLEIVTNGFNCILNGEMWMNRKLVFEYIQFYRERQCQKTSSSYTELTKREQQIIKLLGDGASNTQIADALFVSENTVKAHLHNTFKKLKVKNRLQALLWVKDNIASKEFVQSKKQSEY